MAGGVSDPEGHSLYHPQEVDGGQDDSQRRDGGRDFAPQHGADQDQKFSDETVRAGEPQGGERDDHEDRGIARHRPGQPAVIDDQTTVGPFINGPDAQKERARRNAVVDHLEDRSLDALGVQDKDAQCDESHVTDAGVGDQFF